MLQDLAIAITADLINLSAVSKINIGKFSLVAF